MAHFLQSLFEEVRPYARRFRRNEKELFLQFAAKHLKNWGFETELLEKQGKLFGSINWLKSVNLSTKATAPEYIILAHYDTPTILPPWIEPLSRLIGHSRILILNLAVLAILLLFGSFNGILGWIGVALWASFLLMLIPNPKNFNDNTSGVMGLLYLAKQIGANPEYREKVQFVLVDNEELLLTGADHLRDIWNERGFPYQKAKIISLDCIGWGDVPVIVRNGDSRVGEELIELFQAKEEQSKLINLGIMPINDNYVFRDTGAVVVTFMNPAKWTGGYYIKNIHLPLDNKIDMNKVAWVGDRVAEYIAKGA